MSNTSTVRPVSNNLVIDIDMDSDTVTESNLPLRSRSFLNRVNDQRRAPSSFCEIVLILRHSIHLAHMASQTKNQPRAVDDRAACGNMFIGSGGAREGDRTMLSEEDTSGDSHVLSPSAARRFDDDDSSTGHFPL